MLGPLKPARQPCAHATRNPIHLLTDCHSLLFVPRCAAYTQLKPTRGQWNISIATTSGSDKAVFVPVTDCNTTALSAPCLQPLLSAEKGDKVQLTFTLKDKQLKTADDLPVVGLQFRACYAQPFTVDRPWRKPNAVVIVSDWGGVGPDGYTLQGVHLQLQSQGHAACLVH